MPEKWWIVYKTWTRNSSDESYQSNADLLVFSLTYADVLPPQYNEAFSVLYDKAPSVPYHRVEKIFLQDFGKRPEEIFSAFDKEPIASASIAQVFTCKLIFSSSGSQSSSEGWDSCCCESSKAIHQVLRS